MNGVNLISTTQNSMEMPKPAGFIPTRRPSGKFSIFADFADVRKQWKGQCVLRSKFMLKLSLPSQLRLRNPVPSHTFYHRTTYLTLAVCFCVCFACLLRSLSLLFVASSIKTGSGNVQDNILYNHGSSQYDQTHDFHLRREDFVYRQVQVKELKILHTHMSQINGSLKDHADPEKWFIERSCRPREMVH